MNFKRILLTGVMAASMLTAVACNNKKATGTKVTLWVSEIAGVADLTKTQVLAFAKENGLNLDVTVEGITEADAATKMLTDVEAGADIYCFAQDQFARLVQGQALSKLGQGAAAEVTANNNDGTVAAAKSGEDLYAYPLTSDNGYFMYYDKSVITDTSVLDDIEALVAACEAADANISMEFETSGWYLASWFFSKDAEGRRLCTSEWGTDEEGNYVSVIDTFNSESGLIAAKGAQKLVTSPNFVSSSNVSDFAAAKPSAVVVSGTWAYSDVQKALGENMGVADLPSFKVDGKTYHMGSYSGCKLMGVKPTADAERSSLLHKIARYLTSAKCQEERFDEYGWGPSNKEVLATEKVKANPALVALAEQNTYAVPQGQIHGSWWDVSKALGAAIKTATDDAGLKAALQSYADALDALINMSDDDKNAMTVIGSFTNSWTDDAPMTYDVVNKKWKSKLPFELAAGDKFKVRQGYSWDVAYGNAEGQDYEIADAGWYFVVLDVSGETPVVELEAVTAEFGWTIIGLGGDWDTDVDFEAEKEGVNLVKVLTVEAATEFKVRFNHAWEVNFGTADGGNVALAAGTSKVAFNTINGTITVTQAK